MSNRFDEFNGIKHRYLLIIDIGKILSIMSAILERKALVITNSQKVKLMIAILNIISHYRHFYYNKLHCNNSVVLYCSNIEHYDEYKEIIGDLHKITLFLPNIILVPTIADIKKTFPYYHNHIVSFIIEHTRKLTNANGQTLIVNILGQDPIEYQYLNICQNSFFLWPLHEKEKEKIVNYIDIWENILGSDERFNNPIYKLGLKKLLLPYCILHKKVIVGSFKPELLKHNHVKTIRDELFTILETSYDPLVYAQKTIKNVVSFSKVLQEVLYSNRPYIRKFVKDFMENWGKKLKDKGLHNINNYNEIFDNNNININWLKET